MLTFEFTSAAIAVILGAVISLLFSYVPGLSVWFAGLKTEIKQLVMAGLMLVVTGAAFGLVCAGIIQSTTTCDKTGLIQVVFVFIQALMANQATYALSPQTKAVESAKAARDGVPFGPA